MRLVLSAVLTVSLGATAFAQRGGHGGGGGGFSHGGGGFSHAGGGFSHVGGFSGVGAVRAGGFSSGSMRGGLYGGSGFRGPIRGNFGFRGGYGRYGFRYRGPRFVGFYGWPYYGYGFGYDYWDPFLSDYYTPTVSYPYTTSYAAPPYEPYYDYYPPEPEPPPVVINEPPPPPPAPRKSNEPISYLIAFNDHNIKLALAYWTEDHNLRYVTMEHEVKTAPLSSVDRDLSLQLNRERRVTFALPSTGG